MASLLLSITLFCFGFFVHLAIWHFKRPSATGQALVIVMISSIIGGAILLQMIAWAVPVAEILLPGALAAWSQTILLALAFAAAYVMTYPAIEVESPTLAMIDFIARAKKRGVAMSDLYMQFDDSFLVSSRIDDLLRERLASEIGDRYRLTKKGRRLAQIFAVWRHILGAEVGG